MFYRRGEREMPAFAFEYEHAKAGRRALPLAWRSPSRIIGEDGRVDGVEFVARSSASPISRPHRRADSEFDRFACDMVIPALGQSRADAICCAAASN